MSEAVSECAECGDISKTVSHHTQYEPEKTVRVCPSCHKKIHRDQSHELYPVDDEPDNFTRSTGNYKNVHARIPQTVYSKAKELRDDRDFSSLGEAIRHMCQNGGFDV